MNDGAALERILDARRRVPPDRAAVVAVSGIDGAGKGWVAARLAGELRASGLATALLHADDWLRLPAERFSDEDPAGHFYRRALRLDDLLASVVRPLRERRSVRVEIDRAEETAAAYRRELVSFDDVDVVLLEGIYLLKRALRAEYDVAIWVECSFATALERALARGQEGLPEAATREAYGRIYFPAQLLHLERDAPRDSADLVLRNDPRLA